MVVGCLAFVALVLYAINFYLQATVFFALGLVLLTLWGIFSFYALVEILNQPRTLSAIFKRAPSALWSILLPLIIVILELYIGFVCMIALIVLLILCIFWLGKYFHVVNLSFSTGMNMLPQLLLLLKSPFAIITFVVGGLLLVSTLLLWVTLVLVATVVLYYSAIKQLNSW
jgi:hypothetical protein